MTPGTGVHQVTKKSSASRCADISNKPPVSTIGACTGTWCFAATQQVPTFRLSSEACPQTVYCSSCAGTGASTRCRMEYHVAWLHHVGLGLPHTICGETVLAVLRVRGQTMIRAFLADSETRGQQRVSAVGTGTSHHPHVYRMIQCLLAHLQDIMVTNGSDKEIQTGKLRELYRKIHVLLDQETSGICQS